MKHIIKRYSNRKLYDRSEHGWTNLSKISQIVEKGDEVVIFDMKNGKNITERMIAEAASKQIKKGGNPLKLLRALSRKAQEIFITTEEIEWFIRSLISEGKIRKKEGEKLIKRMVNGISATPKTIEKLFRTAIGIALKEFGILTIDKLKEDKELSGILREKIENVIRHLELPTRREILELKRRIEKIEESAK